MLERLSRAGIPCALGASGLLHALGLTGRVRDWDLTTDCSLETVRDGLEGTDPEGTDYEWSGPTGIHADHKLRFDSGTVELIVRMAIRSEAGVCRIPTIASTGWQGVVVGSPEAWAVAYSLLGREAKADLLFTYLASRGADRAAIEHMLEEPLPALLAARLQRLRTEPFAES